MEQKPAPGQIHFLTSIHEQGNTVVLVTHEEDIANHAARIIRLLDGTVHQDYINEKYKQRVLS